MAHFNTITQIPLSLLKILDTLHFTQMTKIQEESIPAILEGRDVLAQSKTGSGKTVAFGLPVVIRTDTAHNRPQTLIITPTRELAEQVASELRKLAAFKPNLKILTLYGGVPLRAQADSLAKGAHILIGTPGRLKDHLGKNTLELNSIKCLILDEADKMLDMGFYDEIVNIASNIHAPRQTLLFSATFPSKIEDLSKKLLTDPLSIKVDTLQEVGKIDEVAYETSDKFQTLITIINTFKPASLLIFCNTKADTVALADRLHSLGHSVIDLQGDLDQRARNESLIAFSNGSKRILVATDVASRGLDIKEIELVINYDLPFDKEVYTHRIGRTGRADASGMALSLYTPQERTKCDYITSSTRKGKLEELRNSHNYKMVSEFDTLCLNGGKKTKLRKGDILGTLCKEIGIDAEEIGMIDITDNNAYIALHRNVIEKVQKALKNVKIKKKKYLSWRLH
ncbi:ATP-dependent RNA helicase DbpA [Sulfurovum sp.]|uniref:ATP-dependent RNA helicase DbpA n=1 Tax=Sulfurovum sp. TaxID=1969726 RepID=UPI002A368B97|nr:ATP-dependent RNA helicase DbpA [Sulfurovum sp.]MDY0403850.1 ATP-dependent RNA helicase DbpA [Sulfurovum sp.]